MPLNQVLEQRVLTIEISRPEKRNTLDAKTLEEFTSLLANAEADDNVRVVVITAQPVSSALAETSKNNLKTRTHRPIPRPDASSRSCSL